MTGLRQLAPRQSPVVAATRELELSIAEVVEGQERLAAAVGRARDVGLSDRFIVDALGISRGTLYARYGKRPDGRRPRLEPGAGQPPTGVSLYRIGSELTGVCQCGERMAAEVGDDADRAATVKAWTEAHRGHVAPIPEQRGGA